MVVVMLQLLPKVETYIFVSTDWHFCKSVDEEIHFRHLWVGR